MKRLLISFAFLFAFYLSGGARTFGFAYEVNHWNGELLNYLFAEFPKTFYEWRAKGFHIVLFCFEFILLCYIIFTALYRLRWGGGVEVKGSLKAEVGSPLAPRKIGGHVAEGHGGPARGRGFSS